MSFSIGRMTGFPSQQDERIAPLHVSTSVANTRTNRRFGNARGAFPYLIDGGGKYTAKAARVRRGAPRALGELSRKRFARPHIASLTADW